MTEKYKNTPFEPEFYNELVSEECPICFDPLFDETQFSSNHIPVELTKCSHRLHKDCIDAWCGNTKMGSNCLCPVCKENIEDSDPRYVSLVPQFSKLKKEVEGIPEEDIPVLNTGPNAAASVTEYELRQAAKEAEQKSKKKGKPVAEEINEDELLNNAIASAQINDVRNEVIDDTKIPGVSERRINEIDILLKNTFNKDYLKEIRDAAASSDPKTKMYSVQQQLILDNYNILKNKRRSNEEKRQALETLAALLMSSGAYNFDTIISYVMYRYQMYNPELNYISNFISPDYMSRLSPKDYETLEKQNNLVYKQKKTLFDPNTTKEQKDMAERILRTMLTKPSVLNDNIDLILRMYEKYRKRRELSEQIAGRRRKTKRRNKRTNKINKRNKKTRKQSKK